MEKSNLNRGLIMVKGAKVSKDVSSCHILSQASDSLSSEKFQTFRFVSFGFVSARSTLLGNVSR
jgi:hypothetical protein